jgi:hypothetical protein
LILRHVLRITEHFNRLAYPSDREEQINTKNKTDLAIKLLYIRDKYSNDKTWIDVKTRTKTKYSSQKNEKRISLQGFNVIIIVYDYTVYIYIYIYIYIYTYTHTHTHKIVKDSLIKFLGLNCNLDTYVSRNVL